MNQYLEKNFKKQLEKTIRKDFGKRCGTKDIEDFPELVNDPLASRCVTCLVYEELDAMIARLQPAFSDSY